VRIGILGYVSKPEVLEVVSLIIKHSKNEGLNCLVNEELARKLGLKGLKTCEVVKFSDVILMIGGDGTLLRVLHECPEAWDKPILGIRLESSLGFLMEVNVEEVPLAIKAITKGNFTIEEREGLKVSLPRREEYLLNEVVIKSADPSRAVNLRVKLKGDLYDIYHGLCDGILVASSTGSTAYSLSLGGPVLDPRLRALVLLPISPFTVSYRPVVIPSWRELEVILTKGEYIIIGDGRMIGEYSNGGVVVVSGGKLAKFVKLRDNFYERLQRRLYWHG